MASPIIRVLRKHYPDAHLAWLIEPSAMDLLRSNTNLDELIIWPKKEWKDLFKKHRLILLKREITAFSRQMKQRQFDLALDIQGLLRSRWLAWLSGARTRIGFDSKEPGRFLMTKIAPRGIHTGMMGSEYNYMMQSLGLSPGDFHPEIILSSEDENSALEIINGLQFGNKYTVFAPFTTRPQKHWIEDRWAELAKLIHETLGLPVIILGGKDDSETSISIEKLSQVPIFNFTGKTGIGQSAAIIKHASLLIGVDTGLTHMGAAFDCPTVALFGATCPYLYTSGHKTFVIYNRMSCSPCRRSPVCKGDFTCMKSIEIKQVLIEAQKLLEA